MPKKEILFQGYDEASDGAWPSWVCRGPDGCGTPLYTAADREAHLRSHRNVHIKVEDLPDATGPDAWSSGTRPHWDNT
jgi:hypothetical protein